MLRNSDIWKLQENRSELYSSSFIMNTVIVQIQTDQVKREKARGFSFTSKEKKMLTIIVLAILPGDFVNAFITSRNYFHVHVH